MAQGPARHAVAAALLLVAACGGAGAPCVDVHGCGPGTLCVQDPPQAECPPNAAWPRPCPARCAVVCRSTAPLAGSAACDPGYACSKRNAIYSTGRDHDFVQASPTPVCVPSN